MKLFCRKVEKGYFLMDQNMKKVVPPFMHYLFYCSDHSYRFLKPKHRRQKTMWKKI